ncbi:uncharacterized protein [Argopecten irradians]|uniref:uncharacterized protein n=1 Tax=Argopecten irradians TaxID=31199 RepID=UPI003719048C
MLRFSVFIVCLALGSAQTDGVCEDVNSPICRDIHNLNPNMCDNTCYSVALCPRFCGKCPLKCYQCHEVSSPDQCTTATQCPSLDHSCITTQTFTDDFKEVFKLGCAPSSICTSHFGTAIGRRGEDNARRGTLEGLCCDSDLCNVKSHNATAVDNADPLFQTTIPTTVPVTDVPTTVSAAVVPVMTSAPVTTPVCDDVDADICLRLALEFPAMCTIDCIANEVCPRICGKCMGCYQCSHVPAAETCSDKTVCAAGEQCFTVETISATLERGFRMGCLNEKLCSSFGEAAPNIFGKRQAFELSLRGGCCKGDYCNHHALLPTTTMAPTTTTTQTTTTTTLPPTTQKHCPSRYASCPAGWIHYQTSCYALSLTPLSWTDAKAKCEDMCATLADFQDDNDLVRVLQDVALHAYSQAGRLTSTIAWVDGHVSHQRWIMSNGQVADHDLSHNLHIIDTGKCASVHLGLRVLGHHTTTSHYLEPSDCHTQHMPLCEIEHVH